VNVAVVVTSDHEAPALCRWGWWIARAREESLVVFWPAGPTLAPGTIVKPAEGLPDGLPEALRAVCEELTPPARVTREPTRPPGLEHKARVLADPAITVVALPTGTDATPVLRAIHEHDVSFLLVARHPEKSSRDEPLARRLFDQAPCNTLLVRLGASEARHCKRILVPTAGGPHAEVALRLGQRLAGAEAGRMTAFYVAPGDTELATQVGERALSKIVAAAGLKDGPDVETEVVISDNPLESIGKAASERHDLVLMGASNISTVRRLLFGTVPANVLTSETGPAVVVVRRRFRLLHRLRNRMGRLLDVTVPQMDRDERVALYETLQSGSAWNFDFLLLIGVSTAIATLGLIQNSGAVVIGAMLVAPLMTPILGAGLALVQGNLPLLRRTAKAIVLGYGVALAIGFGTGAIVRLRELTPELSARGGPTLLDMGVGFLAGIAAAYCLGRPGLLAALPGVAIAAALVPPIATTGVSLAWGETANASGAAMLFGSNVVAIILGAALSLYAGGVRGKREARTRQRWVRLAFLALLIAVVALAFPLASGLSSLIGQPPPRVSPAVRAELGDALTDRELRLDAVVLTRQGPETIVDVTVASEQRVDPAEIDRIAAIVRRTMGDDQRVRVTTRLVVEAGSSE
jgi:uncharacterized hydrophobic protein (TIGR00271 family)